VIDNVGSRVSRDVGAGVSRDVGASVCFAVGSIVPGLLCGFVSRYVGSRVSRDVLLVVCLRVGSEVDKIGVDAALVGPGEEYSEGKPDQISLLGSKDPKYPEELSVG